MIRTYYCVKDTVTGQFGNAFPCVNEASAKRYFNQLCKDKPELSGDLQLYKAYDFNVESGEFSNVGLQFIQGGAVNA